MTRGTSEVEQRRARRRPVYMKASISHSSLSDEIDCVVMEISQDGARLQLLGAKDLPLTFLLRLDGESELRLCSTAWRSDRQLGVEFSQHIVNRNIERGNTSQKSLRDLANT
jgi:hypothetical protein